MEMHRIVDYSLLIGIHDITNEKEKEVIKKIIISDLPVMHQHVRSRGLISSDQEHIYFMGIIDCFTTYGMRKRAETFIKDILYWRNRKGISCVNPTFYAERFTQFFKEIME